MRIKRPLLSDRTAGNFFLLFILTYLVWTGIVTMQSTSDVKFNISFLIMLIPVILTDGIKTAIESLFPSKFFHPEEDLSKVTVVIPCHNGEKVIGNTLTDLLKRFPPSQIIVASNGSKDKTCQIAKAMGVRVIDYTHAIGKVEAINRSLSAVTTPYVLIMDDDTLIGDAKIATNALESGYQGVAFRVLPIKGNFWTKLQLHEYRKSMDVGRNYHNHSATVQNISGAIGLFETKELIRQINIHTGEFSGEDLQRTLLVHLADDSRGVVISESIVETLVPDTFLGLFNQRVYGWYPGFLANFTKYLRLVFRKNVPFRLRYEAFYNSFVLALLDPIRLLALPILLFTPEYLIFFYVVYVLLELIPYLAMGRHEPFWVILVFPIYGIFNFLARMISMAVFFCRRLMVKAAKAQKYDDYKFVNTSSRLLGSSLTCFIILGLMEIYVLMAIPFTNIEKYFVRRVSGVSLERPLETKVKVVTFPITEFKYIAKLGDSSWSISSQAVDEYIQTHSLESSVKNKHLFVYWVSTFSGLDSITPTHEYIISQNSIDEAYRQSNL